MSISKRNIEGYRDMTTYHALSNIDAEERLRLRNKIIYVCSAYRGDVKGNTVKARKYCRFVADNKHIPLAVHLLFPQFLRDDKPSERKLGITMGLQLLAYCEELWLFGSEISDGMKAEVAEAKRLGITIRHFSEHCKEIQYNKIQELERCGK